MPLAPKKKKKGKKKKKKKLPPYWTNPEDLFAFWGLKGGDLIKTPLGLIGKVLGVKYKTKQQDLEGGGKLWVEYPGKPLNYKAPLDIDLGELGGYTRCHEGDHIWTKLIVPHEKEVEKIEAERGIVQELNRRYRAELQKKVDEEKKKKQKKKKKPASGAAPAPKPTAAPAPAKRQAGAAAARSSLVKATASAKAAAPGGTQPAAPESTRATAAVTRPSVTKPATTPPRVSQSTRPSVTKPASTPPRVSQSKIASAPSRA